MDGKINMVGNWKLITFPSGDWDVEYTPETNTDAFELTKEERMQWYEDYEGLEKEELSEDNNGLTASWYELPEGATELKHLIWYKNMNGQVAEAFRALYRMDDCPHSDAIRNLNKVIAYAQQEKERIMMYEMKNV